MISYGDTEASLAQTTRYDAAQSSRATSEFSRSIEARQFFEIEQSADALLALKLARAIDARPLRVALQFPDDLLADARLVTTLLRDAVVQRQFEADFYILGAAHCVCLASRANRATWCVSQATRHMAVVASTKSLRSTPKSTFSSTMAEAA